MDVLRGHWAKILQAARARTVRFATLLVDLLLDILLWLFRLLDDVPGISSSALRFKCGIHDETSQPEAAMREPGHEGKLRVYRTLYCMNLSFGNIVAYCRALEESRVLTPKFTRLYQSYAQELQAEINQEVVEIINGVELDDMFRFGKVRSAREKELRDPDDVFIEAEARRQELASQRKKDRARGNKKEANGRSRFKRNAVKRKPAGEKVR